MKIQCTTHLPKCGWKRRIEQRKKKENEIKQLPKKMDRFFGFIQSHWGKAGCTHCGKEYTSAPLFICSCHYAMYCGVECQRQHWMEHALICGKGDKREAGEELKDERKLKKRKRRSSADGAKSAQGHSQLVSALYAWAGLD
jgi:hypothetical protein